MKKLRFAFLISLTYLERNLQKISGNIFIFLKLRNFFILLLSIFFLFLLIQYFIPYYYKTTLSEGLVGVYTINNLPTQATNLLSEPLVKIDKNGYPKPEIAEKWEVNNDSTIYTFKIKNNLFWNDGTPVKSSDIKFNLPDVEISYPDDLSIKFKLTDSFAPFPTFLTNPVFKINTLIGLGKFKLSSITKNKDFVTKVVLYPKNSDQNLPNVIINFYSDEKTAHTAFELGEVDSLLGIMEVEKLKYSPNIVLKKFSVFNKVLAIFYNTKDNILSDKNFRIALSFSAPQIKDEDKAKTSIPPYSWSYNDSVKDYLSNTDMAKNYLDRVVKGKNETLILTTTPAFSILGEAVIKAWKDLGIKAVLRIESGVPQNFQALLIQQSIPQDPDQYTLWHSTQSKTNVSNYSSPRIDKDLEDGRKTGNIEIRKEKYADFQKVLLDDAPATFLYFPKYNVIYRKKVENNINKILNLQILQF